MNKKIYCRRYVLGSQERKIQVIKISKREDTNGTKAILEK